METANNFPKSFDLISRSIKFYSKHALKMLGIVSLPLLFFVVALLFGSATTITSFIFKEFIVGVILVVIFFISAIVVTIWSQASLLYFLNSSNKELKITEYYKLSKQRIAPYFITSIFVSVVVFAGFILLIIPGIIFFVRYSLATLISVVEDAEGREALKRSKQYIEGRWSSVAARLLVFFFLFFAVFIAIGILIAIVFGENSLMGEILSNILSFAIAPLSSIYIYEIYKSLKELKALPSDKEEELIKDAE